MCAIFVVLMILVSLFSPSSNSSIAVLSWTWSTLRFHSCSMVVVPFLQSFWQTLPMHPMCVPILNYTLKIFLSSFQALGLWISWLFFAFHWEVSPLPFRVLVMKLQWFALFWDSLISDVLIFLSYYLLSCIGRYNIIELIKFNS